MILICGWTFFGLCLGWLAHEAYDSYERRALQPRHWHSGHPCQNEQFHTHNRRAGDR